MILRKNQVCNSSRFLGNRLENKLKDITAFNYIPALLILVKKSRLATASRF